MHDLSLLETIGLFTVYAAGLIIFSCIVWYIVGRITKSKVQSTKPVSLTGVGGLYNKQGKFYRKEENK